MFKMSFFAGLFLCMLFFVGCVSSASAPEWVTNPDEVLDSKVYLWAVGSGADRKAAESDALSLLVRSIQLPPVTLPKRCPVPMRLVSSPHTTIPPL